MPRADFRAMGSKIRAIVDADEPVPLLEQVAGWFEKWEQTLSRFRLDSELSRLNAGAGTPRPVSATIWAVLREAFEAEALTGGLVNPLVLEALVHAGYDRAFDLIETEQASENMLATSAWDVHPSDPLPALSSVAINEHRRSVCIPPGLGLDFGGVAKGWAAHQAMLRLKAVGPALVSAGGDVALSGPRTSGEPWRIGVENPFADEGYLEMLYLEGGGVATSGKDHRHWKRAGVFQHHIIDPRTRLPASTDIMAATVIAGTVMRAEALAKAVLISGSQAGLALLDDHPDAEAVLVLDDGSLRYSRGIEAYL
jgi:thiamine biosynthesis lipoprotein